MNGALTGTRALLTVALRRDRVRLPIWVYASIALPTTSYATFDTLFPTVAQRQSLATSLGNSASIRLLLGPAHEIQTVGGFTAWRSMVFTCIIVALMNIFTVVRHTRAEEDSGRAEFVAAAVVGRQARLAAAVLLGGERLGRGHGC